MHRTILALGASLLLILSNSAAGFLTGVSELRFPGWDHQTITTTGQTFEDVFGDIDVTVSLVGHFDYPTTFAAGWINTGGHVVPGSHSLKFRFSEPVKMVVTTNTVDLNERLFVYAQGDKSYFELRGATPQVEHPVGGTGSGVMVHGNGFGLDPSTGSSSGVIAIDGMSRLLTVTHQALHVNKFEHVKIGLLVPEPTAQLLSRARVVCTHIPAARSITTWSQVGTRAATDFSTRQSRDTIDGREGLLVGVLIHHRIGIFGRIFVIVSQDGNGQKPQRAKEQLCRQICFADLQQNSITSLRREFANKFLRHVLTDALPTEGRMHGKIDDVQF